MCYKDSLSNNSWDISTQQLLVRMIYTRGRTFQKGNRESKCLLRIWKISRSAPRMSTRDTVSSCNRSIWPYSEMMLYEFQLFQTTWKSVFQQFCLPSTLNRHICLLWLYMHSLIAGIKKHVLSIRVKMFQEKMLWLPRRLLGWSTHLHDTPIFLCYSYAAA